jgi:hypothetical protein
MYFYYTVDMEVVFKHISLTCNFDVDEIARLILKVFPDESEMKSVSVSTVLARVYSYKISEQFDLPQTELEPYVNRVLVSLKSKILQFDELAERVIELGGASSAAVASMPVPDDSDPEISDLEDIGSDMGSDDDFDIE